MRSQAVGLLASWQ